MIIQKKFGQNRFMMLGGLNYSCVRNQNLQCVTLEVACGIPNKKMLFTIMDLWSVVYLGYLPNFQKNKIEIRRKAYGCEARHC